MGILILQKYYKFLCREFSAIAKKEIETKGFTLPVAQDWIKQESNHKNQTGINPSTQNWAGDLNFDLRIPPAVKSKDAQVRVRKVMIHT